MKGRKPKPTALRVLEGNPGKRPINKNEPKPKPLAPTTSSWMSAEAKKLRKQLAPKLENMGLLTEVDGPAFDFMITHYALAAEAAAMIKRDGIIDESKPTLKAHPAMKILKDNSAAFLRYASSFGLTPAERSRLNLAAPEEDDDWGGLIK